MDIKFKKQKLQKQCSNKQEMVKKWGPDIAKKLMMRLSELKAASNLGEISCLPGPECHQLTGNRDNQFAVTLKQPFRLVFEPYNDPPPLKPDGGYDWWQITAILIIEVVDYHG
ncbi:killer suppression protein HigA [Fictibacillus phosphorivorans]|uniref:Killer suppression protein HigA n=1 Tax=Fictibacillus phosphorivorans TaxID=1221500 RepID=A0A165N5K6_9BACL|nr:type II toxin-antitoxin system RelE/ParE family toxin [Fictibacillus phosphorivorans]KZE64694.1 killer suppression protein HigA [Fictibacillus phosphorivorans]